MLAWQIQAQPNQYQVYEQMNKFGQFLFALNGGYVDTVNITQLTEEAIRKVLSELDPHSFYISAKDAQATNEPLVGNFDGVGIEFNMLNDTLLVVRVVAGGPSQKIGVLAGDRILTVDGKSIAGEKMKNTDIVKLLRGPKGTQVNIGVLRRGVSELLEFNITRDKIPLYSISASFWTTTPGVAYINISHFAKTTHDEFKDALKKLGKKPEGLILDLRSNSGGILETAIAIVDEFLPKDALIVYTEGRIIPRTDALATDTLNLFEKGKLVVLIDEQSASASEIVAGAIQDWDRGLLVGRRSFGKGLVQNQSELPDGSLIRITIARYHTPTGRVIQRDYEKGKSKEYYAAHNKRYENGEVYSADSISFSDSLKVLTLKNRRAVYGGGGIMPDIFTPLDTSHHTVYHSKMVRMGIVHQFALRYTDKNRKDLMQKYADLKRYNKNFVFTDADFEALIAFAEEEKLPKNEEDIAKSKSDICVQMKGLIAQDLFGISAYYEVVYPLLDDNYQKALEIMKDWKNYEKKLQK
ncbi:peptidase S41 [Bacteroidia bacterium]|nr:peptidase S41 [Bacteroidia bacterium]